jgi:hypothetical protein
MGTAIIIVVAVMITIIASLMIVRSRHLRRMLPQVPGSNRTALPTHTDSPSSPIPARLVPPAQTVPLITSSLPTGRNVPTMQTPTSRIRVKGRRPGTTNDQAEPTVSQSVQAINGASAASPPTLRGVVRRGGATPPPGLADPIRLPDTVQIFNRQTECKICKQDIHWSSRQTGWVRCLKTSSLVHGHCQNFVTRGPDWCAICDGPCASGQPMRVEGL